MSPILVTAIAIFSAARRRSLGPFSGSIYGDFYGGGPNKTGWLTADIDGRIFVPRAGLDFDLRAAAASPLANQTAYQKALQATSLAEYLQALEEQKPNPSTVIEKKRIFIGAPNAATLEARFHIAPGSNDKFKYIKSDRRTSPDVRGIELSPGKDYYTNTQEIEWYFQPFIDRLDFSDRYSSAPPSPPVSSMLSKLLA